MEPTFNSSAITPDSSCIFWFLGEGDDLLNKKHFKELNYLFNFLLLKDNNIKTTKTSILTTENFNSPLFLFIHFMTGKEGLGEIFSKSKHYISEYHQTGKSIILINECNYLSDNDIKRTAGAAFKENALFYFS